MKKVVDNNKTREALLKITKRFEPFGRTCKVKSVDSDKFLCVVSPIDNPDIDFFDVKLSCSESATFVNIPSVESVVIVNWLDQTNGYIVMFSEIDKQLISNKNGENLKTILKDFATGLMDAINLMTLKHPQGPTIPEPINKVQFDQVLNAFETSIDKLLKD